MATKIRRITSAKQTIRYKRKRRIRARLEGSVDKPRFAVFRSNRHLYVQLVDDLKGHTLVAASTLDAELKDNAKGTIDGAKSLGNLVAKRALAKKISQVVFDRSGYLYHGQIKALADAAREGGLKF
jgi:large subunit ribosomal protein L18